jgi:hypothetical protein
MRRRLKTAVPVVVIIVAGLMSAQAVATPRRAKFLFDASTLSATPHALDYNEVTDEWAVLYEDASVRFYNWGGGLQAGYASNVSPLLTLPKYTDPGLSDLIAIGPDNASRYYLAIGGNPLSEPLDSFWAFELISYQGGAPKTIETLLHPVVANVHLARWDLFIETPNTISHGYDVGLDATGTILLLDEDDRWVLLPNAGIVGAQSVCMRYLDTSPVVLHNNEVSVIRRKNGLQRTGPAGGPYVLDFYSNPDNVVGEVMEHYAILNLPAGAQLIDVATIFDFQDLTFTWNDVLFVLDADGGGVYALLETVPGDANGDGKVDGGDLAIWQQHYDPLGLGNNSWGTADFDGDGKVDGGDLALWQQHYDPVGASGVPGASVNVPEPTTMLLLAAGLLGGAGFVRRRG